MPRAIRTTVEMPGSRSTFSTRVMVRRSRPVRLASSDCEMSAANRALRIAAATSATIGSGRTSRSSARRSLQPAASWPYHRRMSFRSSALRAIPAIATAGITLVVFAAPALALPATRSVDRKVVAKYDSAYDDSGAEATCRRFGTASWDCQIRTAEDQATVAGSGGDGKSEQELERDDYSFRCTATYSKGRVVIGRFIEHHYDGQA